MKGGVYRMLTSSPGRGTEKRENPVLFPEILCAYRRAGHAAAIPGGA